MRVVVAVAAGVDDRAGTGDVALDTCSAPSMLTAASRLMLPAVTLTTLSVSRPASVLADLDGALCRSGRAML